MNPEISIVMPVYNCERFISESIRSILNQSFKNYEFIIVDDASTDKSICIINEFKENDNRIIVIRNKKNLGITKSLNKGIKKAKGKYIARMDADDISLPRRLEKQHHFLENNSTIFLCGTDIKQIKEDGKLIPTRGLSHSWKDIKKKLESGINPMAHPSIMFRNKNILYREKITYSQDLDLYLRLLSDGKKMVNLLESLVHLRLALTTISSTKYLYQKMFVKQIFSFFKERQKYGKDSYNKFDERSILCMDNSPIQKESLIKNMTLFLKYGDYKNANKLLKNFRSLDDVSINDWFPYFICVKFPIVYKIRRFILNSYP